MTDVGGPSPLIIPGQVVLDRLRKQAEQASRLHSSVVTASVPASRFLLWLPLMIECDLKANKPFLCPLPPFLVRVYHRNRNLTTTYAFEKSVQADVQLGDPYCSSQGD